MMKNFKKVIKDKTEQLDIPRGGENESHIYTSDLNIQQL